MSLSYQIEQLNTAMIQGKVRESSKSFASSLVQQYYQRGTLSDKQQFYVNKLIAEAREPETKVETTKLADSTAMAAIIALFDTAASKLKWPSITLSTDERTIVLSRAGSKSTQPGSITVKWGGGFDAPYLGRINKDGTYTRSPKYKEQRDVTTLLQVFASDPAMVAAAYGKKTGCCCFCSHDLTDARSVSVGYGPICAKNYGLPWGSAN